MHSELLWSQMIQLRSSLPLLPDSSESKRLVTLPADMKSEHRSIATTAHAVGVQPCHVTSCGDWNTIKAFDLNNRKHAALAHVRKHTFSLLESLFSIQRQHAGNSLFCNLWHLPLTEISMAKRASTSPSLVFPRSTLLVGRELSIVVANNCDLKQFASHIWQIPSQSKGTVHTLYCSRHDIVLYIARVYLFGRRCSN